MPDEEKRPDDLAWELARAVARAVLSLADTAGMPDSFWEADSRVALARLTLGVPPGGRHTHAHLWEEET